MYCKPPGASLMLALKAMHVINVCVHTFFDELCKCMSVVLPHEFNHCNGIIPP